MNVPRAYTEDVEVSARISGHLRAYMVQRGWDQTRLAEELDVNKATVSRILTHGRGVGIGLALRICRRLLINPHRLFLEDPPQDQGH